MNALAEVDHLLATTLRHHPESQEVGPADWFGRTTPPRRPPPATKNNRLVLSTAATVARVARCARDRYHGGDNRGIVRERGHPQGGPHQPQDRGGEDRHTTILCNATRATHLVERAAATGAGARSTCSHNR